MNHIHTHSPLVFYIAASVSSRILPVPLSGRICLVSLGHDKDGKDPKQLHLMCQTRAVVGWTAVYHSTDQMAATVPASGPALPFQQITHTHFTSPWSWKATAFIYWHTVTCCVHLSNSDNSLLTLSPSWCSTEHFSGPCLKRNDF